MKNPTILKDELSLLRSDKSAVLTELKKASKELKDINILISKQESKLAEVRSEIQEETARLQDIQGRAVSVRAELTELEQGVKNFTNAYDISKQKNTQEERLHLGRIRELEETEKDVKDSIAHLKSVYDKNSKTYNDHESERLKKLRTLDKQIEELTKVKLELDKEVSATEEKEKKLTKERLKREDKLRLRERANDAREVSISKREEDLITMSKDMSIVYGRLKELYAREYPDVDLDKLIFKAI